MSKLKLEFDMEDQFDREEAHLASHARDIYLAIYDFERTLRSDLEQQKDASYSEIIEALHDCLERNDVNLDMLS